MTTILADRFNAIRFVLSICLGLALSGCIPLILLGDREYNVSDQPKFAPLFNKVYAFRKDVFIYKNRDRSDPQVVYIGTPGITTNLPYSVVEYERDPANWQLTDTWAQRGNGGDTNYAKSDILDIIRADTLFTVERAVHIISASGYEYDTIYLKLVGYDACGYKVQANQILNKWGDEVCSLKYEWVYQVEP